MKQTDSFRYLILDSAGTLLSHALLMCPPSAPLWQLTLLDRSAPLEPGTRVHLVGMEDRAPSRSGQVLSLSGDRLRVEPSDSLGDDLRRNLRIPVRFDSYLYPITGTWKGRRPVFSRDLSCGGLAFCCGRALESGERVEVVIPVTTQPLLLRAQVLRPLETGDGGTFYASKFVDLTREEEAMVREAVFCIQLEHRRDQGASGAPNTERNVVTCV